MLRRPAAVLLLVVSAAGAPASAQTPAQAPPGAIDGPAPPTLPETVARDGDRVTVRAV